MPQRGRPPQPGTAEEKAALRREKVRLYVKAHRERKKTATGLSSASEERSEPRSSSSPSSSIIKDRVERNHESEDAFSVKSARSESGSEEEIDRRDGNLSPAHRFARTPTGARSPNSTLAVMRPQGGKEFAVALMGAFRGQFLPPSVCVPARQEFGSELVTPCSVWITNAYGIALKQDSGALKSTILAVGLALTGAQYQDDRLKLASLDVYRKALRQVRTDLKPLEAGQTTNYLIPYLTCLAAAMYEMVHDGFSANIVKHVTGAISLMELLPRDTNISHLLSDLLLEDLCMWEIVFALKNRYPSRLRSLRQHKGNRAYRVAGESQTTSCNATILGDLLDAADEIPTIMARMDQLRAEPHSDLKYREYEAEMRKLSRIIISLDEWAVRFHLRFGPIYVQVDSTTNGSDPSTQSFRFVSYEVAASWVYCLTFLVCVVEANIEALTEVLRLHGSRQSPSAAFDATMGPQRVIDIVSQVQQPTGYEMWHERTGIVPQIQPGLHSNHDFLRNKMNDLRSKLRTNLTQLIEAMCIFIPQPKGIIGQSLVLFPLNRCKFMLKKEQVMLQEDLDNMKVNGIEDNSEILQNMERMSHAMTVYETLEQNLAQTGMPLMPDD